MKSLLQHTIMQSLRILHIFLQSLLLHIFMQSLSIHHIFMQTLLHHIFMQSLLHVELGNPSSIFVTKSVSNAKLQRNARVVWMLSTQWCAHALLRSCSVSALFVNRFTYCLDAIAAQHLFVGYAFAAGTDLR